MLRKRMPRLLDVAMEHLGMSPLYTVIGSPDRNTNRRALIFNLMYFFISFYGRKMMKNKIKINLYNTHYAFVSFSWPKNVSGVKACNVAV